MKFRFVFFLLFIVLAAACRKVGGGSQPVIVGTQGSGVGLTSPTVQAVATVTRTPTFSPVQPIVTPSNTPWPTNTRRPTRTPSPTPTWWSSLAATPNQQQITPTPLPQPEFTYSSFPVGKDGVVIFGVDRQEKWAEALAPFPVWEIPTTWTDSGPNETITVTAEFKPTQLLEIDLDQDVELEIVIVYILKPPEVEDGWPLVSYFSNSQSWHKFLFGEFGIAVFDDNDELLWNSETVELNDYNRLDLFGLNVSEDMKGVILSNDRSGGHQGHTIYSFYLWQDSEMKQIWEWTKIFYSSGGVGFQTAGEDQINFQDVDGDGFMEILVTHQIYNWRETKRCCYVRYYLNYPGVLVFKWDGDVFNLAYLLLDGRLQPIRSQSPTALAPYVDRPIVIDGDFTDWAQVEYVVPYHGLSGDLTYNECSLPGETHFVWDDENLYIRFRLLSGEEFELALDTGPQMDFETTVPDSDEVFLTVSVDEAGMLELNFESEVIGSDASIVSAVGEQTGEDNSWYSNLYPIEMAIPLELLGSADIALTNSIGWGQVERASNFVDRYRVYYPEVQTFIGFAIQTDRDYPWRECFDMDEAFLPRTAALDMNNPTTWGTLLFTADRGSPTN